MPSHAVLRAVGLTLTAAVLFSAAGARADEAPPAPPATQTGDTPRPAEAPKHVDDSDGHPAPNSVYAEGLGAGILYSINYERLVTDDVGVRVGFSYTSLGASSVDANGQTVSASASFITIPITVSYIGIRGRKSSLELGGGATIAYASGSANGVGTSTSGSGMEPYGVVMVGYRLHPVDGPGFQFRVGAMALAGKGLALSNADPTAFGVLPWLYLSLGASF